MLPKHESLLGNPILRGVTILSNGSHAVDYNQNIGIGVMDKLKTDRFTMGGRFDIFDSRLQPHRVV